MEGSFTERRLGRYDWTELLDGSLWKMAQGEYGSPDSFRRTVYAAAERRGKKVRVSIRYRGTANEHVLLQAVPRA